MREWESLSHVRWYCRYHVVFVPKYRKRTIFGQLRRQIGGMLRELCVQHEVELIEGHAMPDHRTKRRKRSDRNCFPSGGFSPLHEVSRERSSLHPREAPSGGLRQTTRFAGGS
jgi:Transposase IS200 like